MATTFERTSIDHDRLYIDGAWVEPESAEQCDVSGG
jgi:hypothetical protein